MSLELHMLFPKLAPKIYLKTESILNISINQSYLNILLSKIETHQKEIIHFRDKNGI